MSGEVNKESVAKLMALYFENFTGDIQPARPVMAGHLMAVLKETTFEVLEPLVISVAQDGLMITRNTLLLASKKKKAPVQKPTYQPPYFESEDNANAIPMPDYVREELNKALRRRYDDNPDRREADSTGVDEGVQ